MLHARKFTLILVCLGLTSLQAADWPQWRGPDRSGVSPEKGLLKEWPKEGPKVLWTATGLGGGYSTPSVAKGHVFGMSYRGDDEVIWCLDEKTGAEKWVTKFASKGKAGYNEGSRSTPTINDDHAYAVGVSGDLICVNIKDGKIVWQKNFGKDFKGKMMSGWGFSESPLIDGDKIICTPGSDDAAIVALNKLTGETIWESKIAKAGGAAYSSLIKGELGDRTFYLTILGKDSGVVCVDAKTGELQWKYNKMANETANIPTVIYDKGTVFASTGYGDGGTAVLNLSTGGEKITFTEKAHFKANELQNHHGGMVKIGDYVYLGRAHNNGFPTCVKFDTGEIVWKENRGPGTGSAALSAADGMLYFRYENAKIALVEASPKEYRLVSEFKLAKPSGKPSWPHPVIANGKLLIRDQDTLTAFDIKAQ